MKVLGAVAIPDELADGAVYHYHPSLEQVQTWVEPPGMAIDVEGMGNGYEHFVVRKR